jgi:uncharacterized membrane protein YeaQ/YmgE (transglycosylase-associated protein family)
MGSGSRTYDSTSNITVASGGTFRALNIASLGSLTVQAGGTALVVDSSFTTVSNSGTITATETNVSGGVTLCAAAPTVGAGQIGLGGTTDVAASAGAGAAPPATVDGYLVINGLTGIVWWLVVGLIAGWAAGKIMKGAGYGVVVDIVLGIVGGVVGGWIMTLLGYSGTGGLIASILVAILGAVVLIWITRLIKTGV